MIDKWIIGTGFSRGIGYELIQKLNDAGYKIIHLGRKKTGFEHEFLWWDLLNPISDNPLSDLTKILFGKSIQGFFYSAGVMPLLEVNELDQKQKRLFWQSQAEAMRVNYLSCAELVEEILPFLTAVHEPTGKKIHPFVAHLSSLAAVNPLPGLELYGATKAAALHYFTWLAKRFPADEITCLSLHPGAVKTDMVIDVIKNQKTQYAAVKILSEMDARNSLMTPEDAASKIFEFLFYEQGLKFNSHGKLFLVDSHKIY